MENAAGEKRLNAHASPLVKFLLKTTKRNSEAEEKERNAPKKAADAAFVKNGVIMKDSISCKYVG